ncbi:MAG: ABC transporter permease subunit [Methanobacterium sp.]|jgi:ABC-type Na+ efflux pump permease subunit
MKLWKSWVIASKDFSVFRKKKSVIYSVILIPLLMSIFLPFIIGSAGMKGSGVTIAEFASLLNSFSFFFVILAASLTTVIASYSLIGEKIEKSIEPLLATPTTDKEILLGKSFAAFLPPILSIYIGLGIFMVLIDKMTYNTLGYFYYPNWNIAIIIVLVAPLASILSVELGVILSSRVNDVRAAQQLGQLIIIPFFGIYILGEIGYISLGINSMLVISAIMLVVDIFLFYISTITFRREEILTKWK